MTFGKMNLQHCKCFLFFLECSVHLESTVYQAVTGNWNNTPVYNDIFGVLDTGIEIPILSNFDIYPG